MTWTFGDPSGAGDQFVNRDNVGKLVAFVAGKRVMMDTQFGETEATECQYVVTIEDGDVYDDAVVFGNLGKSAFSVTENIIVGRIRQGEAKPGKNAPFYLEAATDDDKLKAAEWFTANAAVNSAGVVTIQ